MFLLQLLYQILHFPHKIWNFIHNYHSQYEKAISGTEKDIPSKLKKGMLLYYCESMIVYYVLLYLYNPHAPFIRCIVYGIVTFSMILLLRKYSYKTMSRVFVVANTMAVYVAATFNENEPLKVILLALMIHNVFFLLPDKIWIRMGYIAVTISIIQKAQSRLFTCIAEGNWHKLEIMLTDFHYTWPLIFLMNHSGEFHLARAYQKAVHETKEFQNKLSESNQKLINANQKLSQTLSELEKRNEELKEALQARELFIASVSHELRNPLNAMIGNIELLILDMVNPKWLQMLETCKVCGEVLLGLINNVLDVAKINAEKLELHYLPENFHRLAEKIWKISSMRINQKGLEGVLRISHNFPKYLEIDSHRLTQVLLNLIGNSSKFTAQGFVKVIMTWCEDQDLENLKEPNFEYTQLFAHRKRSETEAYVPDELEVECLAVNTQASDQVIDEERISSPLDSPLTGLNPRFFNHILCSKYAALSLTETKLHIPNIPGSYSSRKRRGVIKIEIIDTGCGISQPALHRIFQPFTQADSSITRRFGGTGLGLYITQQLIQKMGGQIKVYSEEKVGSNFCVLIPTQTVTREEVKEKLHEELENCTTQDVVKDIRALVVDDGHSNQAVICSYLKKLSIQAETANNGKEALEMFKNKPLDYYTFITMDLQMPVMDGLTACKRIRAYENEMEACTNIPIIVITGNCTEIEKNECLREDGQIKADYFYRKPFSYEECKNAAQFIINKKSMNSSRKNKVLIVDDDPFNQMVINEYLRKYGFKCEICANGLQALQKLSKEKFDAVLMDCEMPQMDGYTATRKIIEMNPKILVIGITGNTGGKPIERALASGMKYVESKPINFQKLVNLLSL